MKLVSFYVYNVDVFSSFNPDDILSFHPRFGYDYLANNHDRVNKDLVV